MAVPPTAKSTGAQPGGVSGAVQVGGTQPAYGVVFGSAIWIPSQPSGAFPRTNIPIAPPEMTAEPR